MQRRAQSVADYERLFEAIKKGLFDEIAREKPDFDVEAKLQPCRELETRASSDDEIWDILVRVIFYSGFNAATVSKRLTAIRKHLGNYKVVRQLDKRAAATIAKDPTIVRNKRKIGACVANAEVFEKLIERHGSFTKYVDSYSPRASLENLFLLKEDLDGQFGGLGPTTTYHFMMDIGLPVLKPDRVVLRIFKRLGLIDQDYQLLRAITEGRKFATATGEPIRYVDRVIVTYGQESTPEFELKRGICLEEFPRCCVCPVRGDCLYAGPVASA
jgi:DNA-3-methyladenine glycosylase I